MQDRSRFALLSGVSPDRQVARPSRANVDVDESGGRADRDSGDTFLLNSPRFPTGDGRGQNTKRERSDPPLVLPGREPP